MAWMYECKQKIQTILVHTVNQRKFVYAWGFRNIWKKAYTSALSINFFSVSFQIAINQRLSHCQRFSHLSININTQHERTLAFTFETLKLIKNSVVFVHLRENETEKKHISKAYAMAQKCEWIDGMFALLRAFLFHEHKIIFSF